MKQLIAATVVGLTLATTAVAEVDQREASIPFANHARIRDFAAEGNNVIYLQDISRRWYRVELFGFSPDLQFAWTIGIIPEPTGSFNRWSSVVVNGQRYRVKSMTESDGPPARNKRGNVEQAGSAGESAVQD